ncbi:MAG TPA: peptidase S10 [Acetobacteraceae bacterium]|nr:peptidase S10 [Acetobacteraceae bacterium]
MTSRTRIPMLTIRLVALLFLALPLPSLALAQTVPVSDAAHVPAPSPLPPAAVTHHTLALAGRTLHFTATAGHITLPDEKGAPEADIAYIAYTLDGADPKTRPVTFVFNGGPGEASAWLQLGAVGPWRIRLAAQGNTESASPSATPDLLPNEDTWLDFTDLVFIDPAGTGYSRILSHNPAARKRLWSVKGDIDSLSETIRRWLEAASRVSSPKFLLGESYGGFRVPRLARVLEQDQGIGVSGLIMVSPVLDFGGSDAFDPLYWVERLPSLTAVARARKGPVTRASLADVESYAAGDFLRDLLAGPRDQAALSRMAAHVAQLTGIDPSLVLREDGTLNVRTFLREIAPGRIASFYDATVTGPEAEPADPYFREPDPVLDRLTAPVTSAMLVLYSERLRWHPVSLYRLSNPEISEDWDFGEALSPPQSVTALREDLALDPRLHVLIAHGLFDLVTPYFATALILAHLPEIGPPGRVRLATFEGGHMFYSRDSSRAAFRADAETLITGQ